MKEPWQMTKNEYFQVYTRPKLGIELTSAQRRSNKAKKARGRDRHARYIQQAIAEGKDVPAVVLAEFRKG